MLYVADQWNHRVVSVNLDSISNKFIIGSGPGNGTNQFYQPMDISVRNNSLYILDFQNQRVQKIALNSSNSSPLSLLTGIGYSYYFYVNDDYDIYLSKTLDHYVVHYSGNPVNATIVAGMGVVGSNASQLNTPFGIFINQQRTVYIADSNNHRIMKWFSGAAVGIVVAGNGTSGYSSTQLNRPTQVIVDNNEYMYISEADNSRITRWGPNSTFGVCIAGCTGSRGTAANQLYSPHSLTFDRYGSLYVSDRNNHRVQKFQILSYNSK